MPQNRTSLKKQIIDAFSDVAFPGDDNLVPKTQYDEDVQCAENVIKGKHWRDLRASDLDQCDVLSFVTAEAFHFYLPAFLVTALAYQDGRFVFRVLSSLRPPRARSLSAWFTARMKLISPNQRHAIKDFLRFVIENNPQIWTERIYIAICDYWFIDGSAPELIK
jgi:hypothetical protein